DVVEELRVAHFPSSCRSNSDNRAPNNLAALQCGIRFIDLVEAVSTGNGLGDTHLPASRQHEQLRQIGADATAIRAHQLDATAHQASDLDPRGRRAGGDTDHHHAPAVAGHGEGLHDCLRTSQSFDGHINSMTVCQGINCCDYIPPGGIHRVGRSQTCDGLQLVIAHVHSNNLTGAKGSGDLNDVRTHTTHADHCHHITRLYPSLVLYRPIGSHH